MALGHLIARSTFAPVALGVLIALAGPAWLIGVLPQGPAWSTLAAVLFGVVAEVALAISLLIAAER